MGLIDFIVEQPNYIKYLIFLFLIFLDAVFIEGITGAVFGVDKSMSFTNFIFWVIGKIFGITLNIKATQFFLVALAIGSLLLALKLSEGRMHRV